MTSNSPHPQRLYLFQVAILPPSNIPVPCYLIQTDDGKNILIDSGLPEAARIPSDEPVVLDKNVIEQLALIGLQPGDIDMLISSHFDFDHAGHHGAFPDAELIVQRRHYEYAFTSDRCAVTRPEWDQPLERYRLIDGDMQLLPGLNLIETSGHVPGHQSVLVRLPETGAVLITVDAVSNRGCFTPDHRAGSHEDAEAHHLSMLKLLDLVEREPVSLVIFGHDAEQWQSLKKSPDFYT